MAGGAGAQGAVPEVSVAPSATLRLESFLEEGSATSAILHLSRSLLVPQAADFLPVVTSMMSYGAAVRSYTSGALAAHLATLPIAETIAASLGDAAAGLAETIREALSTPPSGPHDAPWAESGALRASIAYSADESGAAVGSDDPAAAPQEFGTATVPPRPFLAPAAAARGEMIARQVGAAAAALFSDT